MKKIKLIFLVLICTSLINCAKRGIPEGGPKDEDPPILVNAEPVENSINFDQKRIRLYFNEYIKLKDFRKQLVVSPPLDKSFYSISPQSGASKYIQIDIKEKLDKDNTYVFNFGQSVVDNNEENKLPFFKYAFSTGEYVDSLYVSGNITSSLERESDDFISTFLYPVNKNYTDSIIFNGLPNYVGSTLDSTNFKMTNLKKGEYLLIALKDENSNYKFDPEFEKIGFIDDFINLPTNDSLEIKLFKEEVSFKSFKPFLESENRIGFGFKGDYKGAEIKLIDDKKTESIITKNKSSDTLNYWFKTIKYDSLKFIVKTPKYKERYTLKFKEMDKDSLVISPSTKSVLELNDKFKILSNIPLTYVDKKYINVLNKDSLLVPFKVEIDKNKFDLNFDFELLPNDNYIINLYPNAIVDFFDVTNDTVSYKFKTKSRTDYGTLKLGITNVKEFPVIVHLTNNKDEIIRKKILNSFDDSCVFEYLKPADYFVKIIFDKNKNQSWDTGSFVNRIQPEKVFHYEEEFVIRANWILEEKIVIK
ncbi:Ig-like domain-containing protein [Flavobacteriaceae bacterium]|jgi:uncharacterized protein (DUF2141 family)|nr:Ig-like domain-containing protein [Flavobacteriaceae bacterium]